jgi:leader peptidase (prepilin peptidase)/N-methyltransferase
VSVLEALAAERLLLTGWVALFGLALGSFLNVVILRLPRILESEWWQEARAALRLPPRPEPKLTLNFPASRCRECGSRIRPWHNVPVFSWLWLRGRCADCGAAISVQYPAVELVAGVLAATCAWHFGWSPQLLPALALTGGLIALAVIDLRTQLLPDAITLPLLWLGLLLAATLEPFAGLQSAVLGAAAGYGVLWIVYWLFKLATGKEGMGYGDFKLLAALGAWLGWSALPPIILMSSAAGAVTGVALVLSGRLRRHTPLPFGPFLAVAGWLVLLWGPQIDAAWLVLGP